MPSDNNQTPVPPSSGPKSGDTSANRQLATAFELPFLIVSAIAIGGLMGYFLDRWLHTKGVFMLILGGLGFAVGVRDVLRRLK
jgi:F0F1-type ATP synthase assembly protein I